MCAHRRDFLAVVCLLVAGLNLLRPSEVSSASYRATFEDRLLIQPKATSATLDTTNFEEPTILVTTKVGPQGWAYVYRLALSPLRVTDTLATEQSRAFVRAIAAHLDSHPDPDLVVATDSTVRVINSEGGFERTLRIPGLVRSLAAGGPNGRVWVGYHRDTTYWTEMWYTNHGIVGGVLRFESAEDYGTEVSPGKSTVDLRWHDVDEDGPSELVALWNSHGSLHDGTPGLGGLFSWERWSCGYDVLPMDSDAHYMSTIASLGVTGSNSWGGLFIRGSILLNLGPAAGGWCSFTSCNTQSGTDAHWNFRIDRLTAHRLQGGAVVWSRSGIYSGPVAWDLDLDGSAELLVSHKDSANQIRNLYLDPNTGDSLGVIDSERQLAPWGSIVLADGFRRGLMWSGDTLLVFSISQPVAVEEPDVQIPEGLLLKGNFPNPFNAGTSIEYVAAGHGQVRVTIYDALGRIVATMSPTETSAGSHRVTWDARHQDGFEAPSGVYFYRVTQGAQSKSGRMLLLR